MKLHLRRTAELLGAVVVHAALANVVPQLVIIDIPMIVIALHYFINPHIAARSLLIFALILLCVGSIPAWGPLVIMGIFLALHVLISTVFTTKTSLSYAWEALLITGACALVRYGFAGFEVFAPPNIGVYLIIQTVFMYGARELISNFSDQWR